MIGEGQEFLRSKQGLRNTFDRGDAIFYRVRVGRESTEDKADDLARQLSEAGFAIETFVVRLD